ncbi:hypothetical protein P3T43_005857 [Paraburkholderia sp. GAS41]|jgi:hypothetical protein
MKAASIDSLRRVSILKPQILLGVGLVAPMAGVMIVGNVVPVVVAMALLVGAPLIAALVTLSRHRRADRGHNRQQAMAFEYQFRHLRRCGNPRSLFFCLVP